ncbi:hypothetical protein DFQ06_1111 [Algibacter lectus]|uniref:Uncharacterized protein n=1 Tax=Algibacter lectus TaxID=221126 RepID=A0A4R8MJM4_9FLAO|nr:hypothetical protein DFQ06_1111 [Algibacter lectus]
MLKKIRHTSQKCARVTDMAREGLVNTSTQYTVANETEYAAVGL